jgi:CDP-diacylglycerol--serine O-phosphatidyltransferase
MHITRFCHWEGWFMIGFYNYTVYMTYFSLLVSSVGVCLAAGGYPRAAIYCLLLSGVCDVLDGKIARTRKKSTRQEKSFGIQLDSLSDLVCFAVLPAVIGVRLASDFGTGGKAVSWFSSCLLIFCALVRLAYFNVTEEERQMTDSGGRTSYLGLPVTASALIFPVALLLSLLLPGLLAKYIYTFAMVVTAICFVSPFSVRKPQGLYLVFLCFVGALETILVICLL